MPLKVRFKKYEQVGNFGIELGTIIQNYTQPKLILKRRGSWGSSPKQITTIKKKKSPSNSDNYLIENFESM